MKAIIVGTLSALAVSAALSVASAQTIQPFQGDTMQRDGGRSGALGVDFMGVRDASLRSALPQVETARDAAPQVRGFQITHGRTDIVAGHQAQVFDYQKANQTVTLVTWPAGNEPAHGVSQAVYQGTAISYWNDGKIEFWAASAAPSTALNDFVQTLTAS